MRCVRCGEVEMSVEPGLEVISSLDLGSEVSALEEF